jgi:drug/metabolite transporter (DMT)-like permease
MGLMTSPTLRHISAAALAVVGVIHLVLAPEYFQQQAYLGVLFILGGVALAVFAVRLWRADDTPSWLLGALIMAGMGVGFVLSRTVGLPGFKETEWELSGLICLVLEAGFVLASLRALAPTGDRGRAPITAS